MTIQYLVYVGYMANGLCAFDVYCMELDYAVRFNGPHALFLFQLTHTPSRSTAAKAAAACFLHTIHEV